MGNNKVPHDAPFLSPCTHPSILPYAYPLPSTSMITSKDLMYFISYQKIVRPEVLSEGILQSPPLFNPLWQQVISHNK